MFFQLLKLGYEFPHNNMVASSYKLPYPTLPVPDNIDGFDRFDRLTIELFVWSCILISLEFKELSTPYVTLWR